MYSSYKFLNIKLGDIKLENDISDKLVIKSRNNILKAIELLRQNKHKIDGEYIYRYNDLITKLYKELENCQIEKKKDIINDNSSYIANRHEIIINLKTLDNLIQRDDKFLIFLSQDVPIINLVLKLYKSEEFIPKYNLQIEPIIQSYDKSWSVNIIKYLIEQVNGKKTDVKIALALAIFDFLFRNIKFVTENIKFSIVVQLKLKEFIELNKEDFNNFIDKYVEPTNVLEKWNQELEKINKSDK